MTANAVRVVVGEGHPARKGLLRFVLEGDGYEVVGSATTSAELARMLATTQPDVVVLDDGIGATAVQMTREVAPAAKVVLVWPGAVVPIGGDARVEPSQVLRTLGTTVAQVTQPIATVSTMRQPDWVERVRKDPATLRDMLAAKGGMPRTRPSVTELQKRGQRLHPAAETPVEPEVPTAAEAEPPTHDDEAAAAALLILPVAAGDDAEATVVLPDDDAVVAAAPADEDDDREVAAAVAGVAGVTAIGTAAARRKERDWTDVNRRIGALALGGAAVIGAAALSLALSGTRLAPTVVAFDRPTPSQAGPSFIPPGNGIIPEPGGPSGPDGNGGSGGGGPNGGIGPTGQPTYPPADPLGNGGDRGPQGNGGGPQGGGPDQHGGGNDHQPNPNPDPEPGGGGNDDDGLPGNSENNPHGGPPGITGVHPWPDGNPGGHVPGTGNGRHDTPSRHRAAQATPRHHHKR